MPERRHFNAHERAALYLAAEGRCEVCGAELEPGWHADHIKPYSAGGSTNVTNGQALCPTCNLKKGSSVDIPATFRPRQWQQRCRSQYHAHTGRDFLCVACPGAGKTHLAALIAADLLNEGVIERIEVVVPTATLRKQWAKTFAEHGIILDPETMNDQTSERAQWQWRGERDNINGSRIHGWIVTYQSLAAKPKYHRTLNSRKRTLAILDEVHHLGDEGAWGEAAEEALSVCTRRLSLSGTPFRPKGSKIPFAEYYPDSHEKAGWVRFADDKELGPFPGGFDYSYGTALMETPSPVRPAVFEMYDGDIEWFDGKKLTDRKVRLSDDTTAKDTRRKARKMALDPAGRWLETALRGADQRLAAVRQEGDQDAKGLVVCLDVEHAYAVADVLARVTGVPAVPVAASKDADGSASSDEARDIIKAFGNSADRWLVSVAMVSEGVDIPQLRVGVYATNKRTDLFFRQVLGRFVRMRHELPKDADQTAYLFVPKEEEILKLADAVTREVGDSVMASLDIDDDIICGGGGGGQPSLFVDTFMDSTGERGGFLLPGMGSVDHNPVDKIAAESGMEAAQAARFMAAAQRLGYWGSAAGPSAPAAASQPQAPTDDPWHRLKVRRAALDKAVRQLTARRLRVKGGNNFGLIAMQVWADVKRTAGIDDLNRADIADIERAVKVVQEMWKTL